MYKLSLSLNDAFNVVRARKSNVAPNFNFMEQLHCFEQQLRSGTPLLSTPSTSSRVGISSTAVQRCACTNTDCTCPKPNPHFLSPLLPTGASPDSGIEFDRWTSIPE
jgi:dual specificity MAP kinase phosphatase